MHPERYVFWNYVLTEHCLLAESVNARVFLTATPTALSAALETAGEPYLRPDEAEGDFTAAVSSAYRSVVLQSPDRLRALGRCHEGDPPLSVAYLALSVLAAHHMKTDETHSGGAYYPRFAALLGCDFDGTLPAGFNGDVFVGLWHHLADWLQEAYGRQLALPSTTGFRRFLSYPFSHVSLRQVDIDRLPQFFQAHGYKPRTRAPLTKLSFDLYDAAGPWSQFTRAGRRALADPNRRLQIVRQVASELHHWDGCHVDPSGKRVATVEIWLDIRMRRARLYLLARRPRGFPRLIQRDGLIFQSSEEGWYEPVPLGPDDGELLKNGLRLTAFEGGRVFVLNLRPVSVLPLTPSQEFSGTVSDRVLRIDTRCNVLCPKRVAPRVEEYLATLTPEPPRHRLDETLPAGWCLFTDLYPRTAGEPPPDMGLLDVESSVALVPEGGLRLGSRWAWLEGATPTLRLVGRHPDSSVFVDGEAVEIDARGTLLTETLGSPGRHLIETACGVRQRLLVLPGAINPDCLPWLPAPKGDNRPTSAAIAVPRGTWTVVGHTPGQRTLVRARHEGALVSPPFPVAWAIKVGAGPGAIAIHYHTSKTARNALSVGTHLQGQQKPGALRWAEVIYQAAVRRPHLVCGSLACDAHRLEELWRDLVRSACALKRASRRRDR